MDRQRMRRKRYRPSCPFCFEELPAPRKMEFSYGPEGAMGGCCEECGALFVLDPTGKGGGQAVMDLLLAISSGDMEAAMSLRSGIDYLMRQAPLRGAVARHGGRYAGQHLMQPKVWACKVLENTDLA